jgi:DNA-binding LytR/AlgR family response regulator
LRKIHVEIDENLKEPEIIIRTDKMTEQVRDIMDKLSAADNNTLVGYQDDIVQILEMSEIISIYSAVKKVFAKTNEGEYVLRVRLYELEQQLDPTKFIRISNTEIVNLKAVKKLDFSFTGTIVMTFADGSTSYVSRRYVAKIKRALGM